jgi:hypothetical protein
MRAISVLIVDADYSSVEQQRFTQILILEQEFDDQPLQT